MAKSKSDFSDEIKQESFQVFFMSVLLYSWTHIKCMEMVVNMDVWQERVKEICAISTPCVYFPYPVLKIIYQSIIH